MKNPATFILLIALVALIAMCGYLVVAAPAIPRGRWLSKLLSSDGRLVLVYSEFPLFGTVATDPDQVEISILDLETGEVRIIPLAPGHVRPRLDDAQNLFMLHTPPNSKKTPLGQLQATRLTTIDSTCQRIETSSEFLFPKFSIFTAVGNRFLVAVEGNRISVLDSQDVSEVKSISVTGKLEYVLEIPHSDRFYHLKVVTPQGPISAGDPIIRTVDLYQIDGQGAPKQIASWPVGVGGAKYDFYVDNNDHHFFSLSPDLERIDVHSTVDGKLESTFLIAEELDPAAGNWSFLMSVIALDSPAGHWFFDLERREWLPQPEGDYRLFKLSRDRRFLYYCDDGRWRTFKLYDRTPDKQRAKQAGDSEKPDPHLIGEFLVDRNAELERLDSERLVVLSDRHGFSVHFIDIPSGKTTRVVKPLGWVVPLLIVVMLGYAVCCIAWMITSARGGGWAWIDVLLVGGVPLLMMVGRTVMRGHALEISRLPVRFALGGAMAGAMLAAVWIVFGRTRLSLRGTPIWIFTAFLLALLSVVFAEGTWVVWYAVTCAIIPAICLMLPMGLMRWLGFRLYQGVTPANSEELVIQSRLGRRTVPLRDLFLITVVASLLFAASRPIRDSMEQVLRMGFLLLPLLYAVMLGLTALIMALNRRGWVFSIGVVLVAAGIVFLCRESLVIFVNGRSGLRLIPDPTPIPALASCAIALFVYLIPYRLRGWRLGRRIGPGADESA